MSEQRPLLQDARYTPTDEIRSVGGRVTWFARDRLTGRSVLVKTGPRLSILREISILLTLPRGVSAAVLDVLWAGDHGLGLVAERLTGRTALEAASDLDAQELPSLASAICRRLAALHRAGWVHADLKPSNILLLAEPAGEARLLDLAFAWSLASPGPDPETEELLGSTPLYAAPELRRGWFVDARADQYSLGLTLRHLHPEIDGDARWQPILARLTDDQPSRRYPDISAAQAELAHLLALPPAPSEVPPFGSGPLRARTDELTRVVDELGRASGSRSFLVQARPGTGMTRFLLECALTVARDGGPPVRVLDFGMPDLARDAATAARACVFCEERLAAGERVLLGVPDPSPALRWPGGAGADVRGLVERLRPARLLLEPLGAETLGEIAGASLGASGADIEELGRTLHARTAGDLRLAAEGFAHALRSHGQAEGIIWRLSAEGLSASQWQPSSPPPSWSVIPDELRPPLRILARVGAVFERSLGEDLLTRFAPRGSLETLIDRGLLLPAAAERPRFVHHLLREEARRDPPSCVDAVERHLNSVGLPPPEDAQRALEAAARARRLGHLERERQVIERALISAEKDERYGDLRDLLSYPDPDADLSLPAARLRAEAMHAFLGPDWPPARVLYLIGMCMAELTGTSGGRHVNAAAEYLDSPMGVDCLFWSAQGARVHRRWDDHARYMAALTALEAEGGSLVPGSLDLERSRVALAHGRKAEARALATAAAAALAGTKTRHEHDGLMFLAVLSMPEHPGQAVELLERALELTQQRSARVSIYSSISYMHEIQGDLMAFERSAQSAVEEAARSETYRMRIFARGRRVWAWALLDRAVDAAAEAGVLLHSPSIRRIPSRLAFTLLLAGFVALHQGRGQTAIAQMAAAWETGRSVVSAKPLSDLLRYLLDALLDLRAWEIVRSQGDDLDLPPNPEEPSVCLTRLRMAALRAQARGASAEARSLLAPSREEAARQTDRLDAARFLHHLGVAILDAEREAAPALPSPGPFPGNPDAGHEAGEHFRRALELLGSVGYGYHRARSLVGLARATAVAGDPEEALRRIEQAIDLSRRIGSRGVLAEALMARAQMQIQRG